MAERKRRRLEVIAELEKRCQTPFVVKAYVCRFCDNA